MSTKTPSLILHIATKQSLTSAVPLKVRLVSIFIITGLLLKILTHMHADPAVCWAAVLLFASWRLLPNGLNGWRLDRLVKSDRLPSLELNEHELSGSIALLDVKRRERMLAAGEARFVIAWEDVVDVYVRSSFKRQSIYRPAVLSIAVRDDFDIEDQFDIRWNLIDGHQQEIIDYIRQKTGVTAISQENAYVASHRDIRVSEVVRHAS